MVKPFRSLRVVEKNLKDKFDFTQDQDMPTSGSKQDVPRVRM